MAVLTALRKASKLRELKSTGKSIDLIKSRVAGRQPVAAPVGTKQPKTSGGVGKPRTLTGKKGQTPAGRSKALTGRVNTSNKAAAAKNVRAGGVGKLPGTINSPLNSTQRLKRRKR